MAWLGGRARAARGRRPAVVRARLDAAEWRSGGEGGSAASGVHHGLARRSSRSSTTASRSAVSMATPATQQGEHLTGIFTSAVRRETAGKMLLPMPKLAPIRTIFRPDCAPGASNEWGCSNYAIFLAQASVDGSGCAVSAAAAPPLVPPPLI